MSASCNVTIICGCFLHTDMSAAFICSIVLMVEEKSVVLIVKEKGGGRPALTALRKAASGLPEELVL